MNHSIKQFISDYNVHLIDMGHDRHLPFRSKSLKELNHVLNSIYREEFSVDKTIVDASALSLAGILVNDKQLYDRNKKEEVQLCDCFRQNKYR